MKDILMMEVKFYELMAICTKLRNHNFILIIRMDNLRKSIIDRVKQRIREHGENYKIYELCMDEIPLQSISIDVMKTLEKCANVEYVTFQRCELKDLDNLPNFEKLQTLQLGYNQIKGRSLTAIGKYKNLRNLNLENNQIQSVQQLKQLSECPQLTKLYINGNPLSKQGYISQIFTLLPQLELIDNKNKAGQTVNQESQNQGSSDYSDSDASESEVQQERESPNKMKKKN